VRVQDLFDLTGRVAVVTGGATGLGRQMCGALAELGASIVLCGRCEERCVRVAGEMAREHGVTCLGLRCDVTQPDEVERLVTDAHAAFGRIDILINNAGTAWGGPLEDTPLRGWQKVVDVNLTGAFLCTQAVGRVMIEQRGGKIVNIASVTGVRGSPREVLDAVGYSATKGAMIAFTRDLAWKWARHGIGVNAIAPGWFETGLSRPVLERAGERLTESIPMRRLGGDGDLKGAIAYLASPASDYVTGHTLVVDGGASA
jgi:NAD(P)-dependent dehydrogenase (short-subunit alcohol dehydrogenase family)